MSATIEHYGPLGRIFRFENPADLYPVNRYQSLVLATSASIEAMSYAAERGRPLSGLRAIEFCCGGGAAAVMLKGAGLGDVEATDVNPLALRACRRNASINGVAIDRVELFDLLDPPSPSPIGFDLAVCNPPCGHGAQVERAEGDHIRRAIDGGPGGVRFIAPLLRAARHCLVPGGRLVFIITSTMAFRTVWAELDREFPEGWRLDQTTPVAQPYVRASTPEGQGLLALAERREVFVWQGADDRLWRLSWVVVASPQAGRWNDPDRRLWLVPRYFEPREPGYSAALRHFTRAEDS